MILIFICFSENICCRKIFNKPHTLLLMHSSSLFLSAFPRLLTHKSKYLFILSMRKSSDIHPWRGTRELLCCLSQGEVQHLWKYSPFRTRMDRNVRHKRPWVPETSWYGPTWLRLYSRCKGVHTCMFVHCGVSREGQTARDHPTSLSPSFSSKFPWRQKHI